MKFVIHLIRTLLIVVVMCSSAAAQTPNTLDLIGLTANEPAATAYSLRKLSSTYSGYAIQVINTKDSLIKDIGFNEKGFLDTLVLKEFCKRCAVTKWYDQSGWGRDAVAQDGHSTLLEVEPLSSRYGLLFIKFLASHSRLLTTPFTAFQEGFSIFIVAQRNSYQNAIVTKTKKNYPSPWDMYNNDFLTINDGQFGKQLVTLDLPGFYGDQSLLAYAYNGSPEGGSIGSMKNFLFYTEAFDSVPSTFNEYDSGDPLVLGSRNDESTYFNGFVFEVITFPKKYDFKKEKISKTVAGTIIWDQTSYYDILDPINIPSKLDAAIALSLRKLSVDYVGPAIKVSDGTSEKDISFLPTGDLDTLALKKFCASGDCHVTTWYDQSGNNLDATQSTPKHQPAIMKNGVILRKFGNPMIYFDFKVDSNPDSSNVIFLSTRHFEAFDDGFTLFIAGGSNQTAKPFTTLVTKTFSFYPGPWNIFNEYFLSGKPGIWSHIPVSRAFWANFSFTNLSNPVNKPGFHIWSFSSQEGMEMQAFLDGNSNLRTKTIASPVGDVGSPLTIGSQNNKISGLNGWVGEIIVAGKQYQDTTKLFRDLTEDMMSYYYKNTLLSTYGLSGVDRSSVAYSLRKLASGYTGSAVEVYNGLNFMEIGFSSDGTLDTVSLKQFCPANCNVTKWFDQSGNFRHATQTDKSLQPKIVENGQIIRKNGKPSIYFDGSNGKVVSLASRPFIDFDEAFSLFITGGVKEPLRGYNTLVSRTDGQFPLPWDMYNKNLLISNSGADNINEYEPISLTQPIDSSGFRVWSFMANSQATRAYVEDSLNLNIQSLQPTPWNENNQQSIRLGSRNDLVTFLNGHLSEVVAFPKFYERGNDVWNRVIVDQMAHYNIGKTGNCLNFDAEKGNYVNLGLAEPMIPPKAFTIEAWVRMEDHESTEQTIMSFIGNIWVLADSTKSTYKLIVRTHMSNDLIDSTSSFSVDQWIHVAWMFDGVNTVKLYVNGIQVDSESSNGLPPFTNRNALLGSSGGVSGYFNGSIDEVRIWAEARTINQLRTFMYQPVDPSSEKLIAYYNFNEGVGNGINKNLTLLKNVKSVNNFDGTLVNFSLEGNTSNWVRSSAPLLDIVD